MNVELLKTHGTVFGCNAIYRDATPDYIVAIDDGMINELWRSSFPQHKILMPLLVERFEPQELHVQRVQSGQMPPRSNAGTNAVWEALKRDYDEVFLIGFDFLLKNEEDQITNIYDGTLNYGPETRAKASESAARKRYLEWVINISQTDRKPINVYLVFPRQFDKKFNKLDAKYTKVMMLDALEKHLGMVHWYDEANTGR